MQLAVNTCEAHGEMILFKDQKVIATQCWEKEFSHSEVISEYFQKLLAFSSVKPNEIKKIICVNGPGSFTGIRVGVNFAKTLSYSFGIPLVPISTLELLALRCDERNKKILACVDAQKNSVFLSQYEYQNSRLTSLWENKVVEITRLAEVIREPQTLCGSGLERYKNRISPDVTKLILQKEEWKKSQLKDLLNWNSDLELSWENLHPLYVKNSSAEEKQKENLEKSQTRP